MQRKNRQYRRALQLFLSFRLYSPFLGGALLAGFASPVALAEPSASPAATPFALDDPRFSGVISYDPTKAMNGITLDIADGRKPALFDMNGNKIHSWPFSRVRDRVRLLDNCHLLGIGRGRLMVEYDWSGKLVWEHRVTGSLNHHDLIRTRKGNTMYLALRTGAQTDDVVEVDPEGVEVWRWRASQHMGPGVKRLIANGKKDITHLNSLHELEDNRLWRAGDERFRPGNILVSARHLDIVFVIDKETKEVVWRSIQKLDGQHEALMIPDGSVGAGNILIFDNRNRRHGSSVLVVDPSTDKTVWTYDGLGFFSQAEGVGQPLPNGNVLVTSRGGRVFEVTRRGEIVWEWVRGYSNRALRYPYDHCEELAKMERPKEIAVLPPANHLHIDEGLYRWVDRKHNRKTIGLRKLNVLKENNSCDRIIVPSSANLALHFGLLPGAIRKAGLSEYAGRFRLSVSPEGSEERTDLADVTLRLDGANFAHPRVDLRPYTHQRVSLCAHTEALGGGIPSQTEKFAFWEAPRVARWPRLDLSGVEAEAMLEDREQQKYLEDLTQEEQEVRMEHLKALGYVD